MIIKEGFNDKPTHIRIYPNASTDRVADVWIEQIGLKDEERAQRYETLAYATLDELLDLQKELKQAIAGVSVVSLTPPNKDTQELRDAVVDLADQILTLENKYHHKEVTDERFNEMYDYYIVSATDAITQWERRRMEAVINKTHEIWLTQADVALYGEDAGADVARHWDMLRKYQLQHMTQLLGKEDTHNE